MSRRKRTPAPEWAAIDVGFFRDPAVLALKPPEQLAYLATLLWTVENLTDGHVPSVALPMHGVTRRQASRLVEVGLWHPTEGGWQITSWAKWQKPRGEWVKLLEHRRHAAALGNCQRWHEAWCR